MDKVGKFLVDSVLDKRPEARLLRGVFLLWQGGRRARRGSVGGVLVGESLLRIFGTPVGTMRRRRFPR